MNENETTTEVGTEKLAAIESRHYHLIMEINKEVSEAMLEMNEAKAIASEAKKKYERISEAMSLLISKGPNPQQELDFVDGDPLTLPISVLGESHEFPEGVTSNLIEILEEKGGFETVGQLRDYWQAGNTDLMAIEGIGEEKSAEVADAYAAFLQKYESDSDSGAEAEEESEAEDMQPTLV